MVQTRPNGRRLRLVGGVQAAQRRDALARRRLGSQVPPGKPEPRPKRGFIPLCPDFVAELRSPTDSLAVRQAKLDEYIANGTRLGWLLDPEARTVYIYRPSQPVQRLDNPAQVSGDRILPGFVLDLHPIWEPGW